MIRHLDLFSGIGGFALPVEWLGGETVAFVEWDAWCRRTLFKHWPTARYFGDIHSVSTDDLRALGPIDLITGGYPCQPFSHAGKRRGQDDPRHIWPEMRRVIDTVRPRFVLAENVAGHVSMGLDAVLDALEADGYSCGAVVIPAGAVGALHRRARVWIMAHAGRWDGDRWPLTSGRDIADRPDAGWPKGAGGVDQCRASLAHTRGPRRTPADDAIRAGWHAVDAGGCTVGVDWNASQQTPRPLDARADGLSAGLVRRPASRSSRPRRGDSPAVRSFWRTESGGGEDGDQVTDGQPDPASPGFRVFGPEEIRAAWADGSWEADLPRVITDEIDRRPKLRAAGNAIVPVVAYEILRVMLGGEA